MEYGLKEFFDSLEDTGVYVIEKNTMKVLYENHTAMQITGSERKGKTCYQAHGNTSICDNCPVHQKDRKAYVTMKNSGLTFDVQERDIEWNGVQAYAIFIKLHLQSDDEYKEGFSQYKGNEQQLLKILNLVPCGITINEITKGAISAIYINDGFYQMLGTQRENRTQFQGEGALGSIHPDDVGKVQKTAENFVAGAEYGTVNYRLLTGSDTYIWVKLDAVVISREPDKVTIYCAYAEVQTLVETQMELQRNRVLLNASMESAKVSAWWLDLKTHTANLSDTAQKKYKLGKYIDNMPESAIEAGIIDPVSFNDFRTMFEKVYKGEKVTREIKMYHRETDTITWERIIYIPMRNHNGNVTQAVGTSVDITDEKLQKQLEKAVVAANQANQAKTDFLARMSHDMRTPMNAIIGLTALTLDCADSPQKVRDNLSKIRQASNFLLGLVNDILDMAKIEDDSIELNMEPYRYSDFLLTMKTMFKPQCDAKGITITFPEKVHDVYGITDKLRINQIFFNIFSNAVKYTPVGGKISCFLDNLQKKGNQLSFDCVIEDTGIGMSEKFQKNLFTPFTQESNEVTSELQGSGLGLSIAKRLVELMNGSIRIQSKKGKGTKVTVHLSIEIAKPGVKPQTEKETFRLRKQDLADKKVFLVEDHPLNAEIARKLLEKQHMIVTHAENGRVAVEMFNASEINSFDVILMDIRMPEMSGLDATKRIRALDRRDAKSIPIIAMTANAYAEDIQQSLDAGMNAHLVKPINPAVLYETIGNELYKNES